MDAYFLSPIGTTFSEQILLGIQQGLVDFGLSEVTPLIPKLLDHTDYANQTIEALKRIPDNSIIFFRYPDIDLEVLEAVVEEMKRNKKFIFVGSAPTSDFFVSRGVCTPPPAIFSQQHVVAKKISMAVRNASQSKEYNHLAFWAGPNLFGPSWIESRTIQAVYDLSVNPVRTPTSFFAIERMGIETATHYLGAMLKEARQDESVLLFANCSSSDHLKMLEDNIPSKALQKLDCILCGSDERQEKRYAFNVVSYVDLQPYVRGYRAAKLYANFLEHGDLPPFAQHVSPTIRTISPTAKAPQTSSSIGFSEAVTDNPLQLARDENRLNVLYLGASPDLGPESSRNGWIRVDHEAKEITSQISTIRNPQREVSFHSELCVRVDEIQSMLMSHSPKVLHFSGHGDTGFLVLEDRDGLPKILEAKTLAKFVETYGELECLVLHACYSRDVAEACRPYVNTVVGSVAAISDNTAPNFSYAFYGALAHGRPYDKAYEIGRNEVFAAQPTEAENYLLLR